MPTSIVQPDRGAASALLKRMALLMGDELHVEVVMFGNFGPGHWLVLAVVMVLLLAGNKLPGAARALGTSLRIFKSEFA